VIHLRNVLRLPALHLRVSYSGSPRFGRPRQENKDGHARPASDWLACAALLFAASLALPARARRLPEPPRAHCRAVPPGARDAIPGSSATGWRGADGKAVVIENKAGAGGNVGAETSPMPNPTATPCCRRRRRAGRHQNLYPKLGFDPAAFLPIR